jgi:ribosome assembly protein 4
MLTECRNAECSRLVSSSKDASVKVWNVKSGNCVYSFTSHTASVTSVRWGGEDLIYSGSQDTTIKVWSVKDVRKFR